MANTTTTTGQFVTITGLDANWSLAGDMPGFATDGLRVKSIQFNPSGANDVALVRNKTSAGAKLFDVSCDGANNQKVQYYDGPGGIGQQMWPSITIAQWTLSSAAAASLTIELA